MPENISPLCYLQGRRSLVVASAQPLRIPDASSPVLMDQIFEQ